MGTIGLPERNLPMSETVLLAQLERVMTDLKATPTGKVADRNWSQVQRLLANLKANPAHIAPIMRGRDVTLLEAFYKTLVKVEEEEAAEEHAAESAEAPSANAVADDSEKAKARAQAILRGESADATPAEREAARNAKREQALAKAAAEKAALEAATPEDPPSPEELKKAYTHFKRRLKSTQRDEDSGIGNRYTTGGSKGVVAVTPPSGFRPIVWRTLVEQGRLKRAGKGMYQMP